jgi:beta-glucosidase/6-phospho-beta-glucosidase/beta-galactosidase
VLNEPVTFDPSTGFVVTTGIECSSPIVAGDVRRDELRLTGHWDRYAEDAVLTARLGIRLVRYGIPFHIVAAEPGRFDWHWTDRALGALQEQGLTPIADLLHFGVPDNLWGIADPRLPERHLAFVEAFVARYPWIRHYTPVNEPWITAAMSARHGRWNEQQRDERSLVAALANTIRCAVLASNAVRAVRPDAVFLQSDACERWIPTSAETEREAELSNEQRFVAFELTYGREPSETALRWLGENGLTDAALAWFLDNGSDVGAIVGHDYYSGNEREIIAPGRSRVRAPLEGYASLAREFHARLRLPFFLAETNRDSDQAVSWLASVWNDCLALRAEGLPIRGICWYSLTDQVDWDTALAEVNDRINPLGLVDLDRRLRPVGLAYGALAHAALEGRFDPIREDDAIYEPIRGHEHDDARTPGRSARRVMARPLGRGAARDVTRAAMPEVAG